MLGKYLPELIMNATAVIKDEGGRKGLVFLSSACLYGCMVDLERRERILHRVAAGSAFAFALCILPIAQYYLTPYTGGVSSSESGKVAGVSTDASITDVNLSDMPAATASPVYASAADCLTGKEKDLQDLNRFLVGKKQADLAEYTQKVKAYQDTLDRYEGQMSPSDASALHQLIDDQYQPYLKKLSLVEAAVESQKNAIESRLCPLE